jgi:hypothetical protein
VADHCYDRCSDGSTHGLADLPTDGLTLDPDDLRNLSLVVHLVPSGMDGRHAAVRCWVGSIPDPADHLADGLLSAVRRDDRDRPAFCPYLAVPKHGSAGVPSVCHRNFRAAVHHFYAEDDPRSLSAAVASRIENQIAAQNCHGAPAVLSHHEV